MLQLNKFRNHFTNYEPIDLKITSAGPPEIWLLRFKLLHYLDKWV